jgi:ribonuclease-3
MIDSLQKRLGYQFRDENLLLVALTHPSVLKKQSNQRLEFLGDAILGAVVAHILYDLFPNEKEGELARRHASLVCGETLTQVAREIELGESLSIGVSETQAKGRQNASNLEDALEAVLGAMYLDGGFAAVEAFIKPRWLELAGRSQIAPKDAKTALQEWAQQRGLPIPQYRMLDSTGPAHAPLFTIEVTVEGQKASTAKAASKRQAEQIAASQLLTQLTGNDHV